MGFVTQKKRYRLGWQMWGEGTGSRGTTFLGPHGVGEGGGEDPPGPTKSAYGRPKMEKGVEIISFVLPPKAANFFWRIFSAVTPRGGVGWGDPLPSGFQQKALTVLQKRYVGTSWGRTTPDGKGSKKCIFPPEANFFCGFFFCVFIFLGVLRHINGKYPR